MSLRKKLFAIEKKEVPVKKNRVSVVSSLSKTIEESTSFSLSFPPLQSDLLSFFADDPFPHTISLEDILFLDTETTGLSRGSGTVAFLIGVGYVKNGQWHIKQFLMEDYDQEEHMLKQFADFFRQYSFYIT
ncbi:MAG: hypothetical protein GX786_08260, partial [Clostridiales bacterium]|nr:hypothetical protein [Clostridiales bacterium]